MNWDEESLAAKNAALARNKVRAALRRALYDRDSQTASRPANPAQDPLLPLPGPSESRPTTQPHRKAQAA